MASASGCVELNYWSTESGLSFCRFCKFLRKEQFLLLPQIRFYSLSSFFMMDSLFSDLCCDLRERLFVKLRDTNRTMTTLSSERRKTVELDGVHSSVFHGVFPHFPRSCIVRDLSTLAGPIPPKSLLRVYPSGDFCLIAPIQQCRTLLSYHQLLSSLSSSNVVPPNWLKEGFSVLEGQLLIPLSLHGESSFYQVACPAPGEELSSELSTTSIHPFPVRLPVERNEVPVCPFFSGGSRGGGGARGRPPPPPPCWPKKKKKKKKKKKNRPWDSSSQTTAARCLRGA